MKLNKRKGISLIVLVITIIVMIILAAAIILSISGSGVIGKANKAQKDTDRANMLEAAGVAYAEYELEKQLGELNPSNQTAEDYVKDKLDDQFASEILNQLSILDDGTIQVLPTIPKGFTPSIYEGEQKISDGLVIYEATAADLEGKTNLQAMETYNQYVWVPVEGNFERRLYGSNGGNLDSYYVEPLKSGIYAIEEDMSKYADEIAQYKVMKASVESNGGFYIARYEAGLPDGKTTSTVKIDGTDKPVSKKGADVWNNIAWDSTWNFDWNTMKMGTSIMYGDDSQNGAVKVAKSAINSNSNVVSDLVYGVQWDAVMNFMRDVDNPHSTTGEKYIYDSAGMGWYSDNYNNAINGNADHKTGIDVGGSEHAYNKVKNIYDMAGNVVEWTYEAYTDAIVCGGRVSRGGAAGWGASRASGRSNDEPDDANENRGFRVTLYIK